jgi:hypothetical protein
MSRHYKTAMGKSLDMASLILKNEKTRAIGNMNVNARGDVIDSNDQIISDVTKRVNRIYANTTANPGASGNGTAPAPGSVPVPAEKVVQPTVVAETTKITKTKKTKTPQPDLSHEEMNQFNEFDEQPVKK